MRETKSEMISDIDSNTIKSCNIIGNNTLEIYYTDNSRAIRLHHTDIITFKGNHFTLDSGGWRTLTTKERINRYLPQRLYLYQENNIWYIYDKETESRHVFFDGIKFTLTGELKSKPKKDVSKKVNRLKKQINAYVNLINEENLPKPSNGDCWYCLFRDKEDIPVGDCFNDTDHLKSHIKEKYLHGSILVNSMLEAGYRKEQIGIHYHMKWTDSFKRALRKYLYKRLIPEV